MTYPDKQEVEHAFADHFDQGSISVWDWPEVKGRPERVLCEEALSRSAVESRCTKQHAVLRPGKA
jgi:hypothetical protein